MIPRCEHGHIILACPDDDCEGQNVYLAQQQKQIDGWHARIRAEAEAAVRAALGLGSKENDT